ncbi:hypothetical protein ACLB1E_34560 [Escherichia coli]
MSSLDSEAKPDNAGHSVLALTTSHSLVVSSPETFLPDMRKELGITPDLVESYNDELCLLKLMAVQFKTHNHQKLLFLSLRLQPQHLRSGCLVRRKRSEIRILETRYGTH